MNIFKRLFGKKPETQGVVNPEEVIEPKTDPKPKANTVENASNPPPRKQHKTFPQQESPTMTATIPWRTFPIFISSTFADMQAGRDHLKNVVFPKVEEELQQRRIKLEIVDLRWGVDTTTSIAL